MNPIGKKILELAIKTLLALLLAWIFVSLEWSDLWVIPATDESVTVFAFWWRIDALDVLAYLLSILSLFGILFALELLWWLISKLIGIFAPTLLTASD